MALSPFGSDGSDHDTPFDGSGLKLKNVKTRAELYKVEYNAILKVTEKYLLSPPSRRLAPFNYEWLLKLHEEMFGSIWEWAGTIRNTDKNLGVRWEMVPTELGALAMEADKRHDETGRSSLQQPPSFITRRCTPIRSKTATAAGLGWLPTSGSFNTVCRSRYGRSKVCVTQRARSEKSTSKQSRKPITSISIR